MTASEQSVIPPIPEDLKLWHRNVSMAQNEPALCVGFDIVRLIERISRAESAVAELQKTRREKSEIIRIWQDFCRKLSETLGCYNLTTNVEEAVAELRAENARLKETQANHAWWVERGTELERTVERLKAPVSDGEWPKTWDKFPRPSITRSVVNALIAARTQPKGEAPK